MTARRGHLAAVPDRPPGLVLVDELAELAAAPQDSRPRVRLSRWQRMEVEDARCLLMDTESADAAELGPPRAAYLAGRLGGVVANLLDVIDAITEVE